MSFGVATSPRRERLVRFFLVGCTAASIQLALLWLFVDLGGVNYLVGAFVAIELTILFQYVLNNAWTFHRSRHSSMREYLVGLGKTNLVRGTAIPLQLGILYVLVTLGTAEYLVGNAVAIGVTGLYRYALDSAWTWN
ncbi:GtrA family protein [Haloarcula salinisoli]|uniref:GtrA family protein n=1 Tax=Haloarcula salinisoli TaxID=2487746 RepID=A0A8J7YB17_9EURY|nr:GtrA family protein [Halomicroarcula salinisoli]MBX0286260.1 GtrA family protein [Halomicroarcula salinisoli]MBX0302252.1 GtrA family protein [Halomicroarcula salinisoli]